MGGKVFEGTSPIESDDELIYIMRTLSEILNFTIIGDNLLGSAQTPFVSDRRSYPISDLDINMDNHLYDLDHIAMMLKTRLGENSVTYLMNTIYCRLALGTKVYQVDFMFGDYDWQKFAYAGAQDSAFKGVHRNMLLKAFAAFKSDHVEEEHGEVVARAGWSFMVQSGLEYRYRHRPTKKRGEGRVQAFSKILQSDFNEWYRTGPVDFWHNHDFTETEEPELRGLSPLTRLETVITDPWKAMHFLFGDVDMSIFRSFETLRAYIRANAADPAYNSIRDLYFTMCEENRVPYSESDM